MLGGMEGEGVTMWPGERRRSHSGTMPSRLEKATHLLKMELATLGKGHDMVRFAYLGKEKSFGLE